MFDKTEYSASEHVFLQYMLSNFKKEYIFNEYLIQYYFVNI
jgi:hypothetical protein